MYPRVGEKRRLDDINLEDEEAIGSLCRLSGRPVSPKTAMEHEKRIRREIANSNERRRMQSINAGFASLRTLLPHHEGEKLSKAAILQQTAEYIYQLEQEKTRLLSQNCHLKRLLNQQHHSDAEGSPVGGSSPTDDRVLSAGGGSPPPQSVTSSSTPVPTPATSTTASSSGKGSNEPEDVINMRVAPVEREWSRQQRVVKAEDREIVPEKVVDTSFDGSGIDSEPIMSTGVKIEVVKREPRDISSRSPPVSTTLEQQQQQQQHHKVSNNNNSSSSNSNESCSEYSEVQEIRLSSQKTNTLTSRAAIPIGSGSPASSVSQVAGSRATFRSSSHSHISHPTTILTVLPSNKGNTKSLPPLLELRGINEVDDIDSPPTTTVGYVEDSTVSSIGNHTLYIVNSSNSSCQKSLDTICEAIRHLEGDHMFPLEEQSVSDIKEEVVTEETFMVDDDQIHHRVPQDLPHSHHHSPHVTSSGYDTPIATANNNNIESKSKGSSSPSSIHSTHPLGGSMGHLTLHMIPPEPQEVPLELTTSHRANSEPHQYVNHEVVSSSPQHVISHPTPLLHHSTRPGVIVVKHQ